MWRYLAGAASALLLVAAGLMLGRSLATPDAAPIPAPPPEELATPIAFAETRAVPAADEKTKEEKRFNRYDRDKNGLVSRDEFLLSRRKAYDRLDTNGDGTVSFEEYAVKASARFAKADADKSATLGRTEFSTTRIIRKAKAKPVCAPVRSAPSTQDVEEADADA